MKLTSNGRRFGLLAIVPLVLAAGCSKQLTPSQEASAKLIDKALAAPACQSGVDAFKTTLHPWLRDHCTACHTPDGNGPGRGPAHSVADPEAAYRVAAKFLKPGNLNASSMVKTGGNMHCLKDFGSDGIDCKTTEANLIPLVQAWWDQGEKRCPHALPIVSSTFGVPNPLPNKESGTFAHVRLKLEEINPTYRDLYFEFEIQRTAPTTAQHPGSYLIQRPRFMSKSGNWRVKKLQFSLNGELQVGADVYSGMDTLVSEDAVGKFEDPIWTERVAAVNAGILIEQNAATDRISVGFGEIAKVSEGVACHDLDMFVQKIKPSLGPLGCQYCHGLDPDFPGNNDPVAKARWNIEGDDEFACRQFAKQGQRANVMASPVIWFPTHGRPVHSNVIPNPEAILPEWTDWLSRGL